MQSALTLLEKILQVTPIRSMSATKASIEQPDAPFPIFQQLSTHILSRRQQNHIEDKGADNKSQPNHAPTRQVTNKDVAHLMKSLLNVYETDYQVIIVKQLVNDCPHPGLQARFIDFLRSLVFDDTASESLWRFIGFYIEAVRSHVDLSKRQLIDADILVENVETYVAATTMLQRWCMLKGSMPRGLKIRTLEDCQTVLQMTLAGWEGDSTSIPPEEYYRLHLLESSLNLTLQALEHARNTKAIQ